MQKYQNVYNTKVTSQMQRTPGRKDEVLNNAGGYVFGVDPFTQLDRFLLIGSSAGTYYVGASKLTEQNVDCIDRCLRSDPQKVLDKIVEISEAGRAPSNDPALFALAYVSAKGNEAVRKQAFSVLDKVARIPTHLFHFVEYREMFAGWGRGMKNAINNWYNSKSDANLAYAVAKYGQRDGWSHRDIIRLSHLVPNTEVKQAIARFIVKGEISHYTPDIIAISEEAKRTTDVNEVIHYIKDHGLTREMINKEVSGNTEVQKALLADMPVTATLRNLGSFTASGAISVFSEAEQTVVSRLTNEVALKKARVHPIEVLAAIKVYNQGAGFKGNHSWTPNQRVQEALDTAFHLSFNNVPSTGKRYYIGLDVSGSMGWSPVKNGLLTAAEVSAAMCLSTVKKEDFCVVKGFCSVLKPLGITKNDSIETVLRKTQDQNFGNTDCAQPMIDALNNKIPVDVFVIYTDNETWSGNIKPFQALAEYRKKMGINAKLIVCGITATNFSIADPRDPNMLDVAGFDSSVPSIIAEFVKM